MGNEFITIAEAARLAGKTDIEIMRLIKDRLQSSGLAPESVMKKEQREKGVMYVISREFLFEEPDRAPAKPKEVPGSILSAKDEMIAMLQKIIDTKDRQMEDLSSKIDQLIERDRETNILLKGLQERIFLLEDSGGGKKADSAKNQTRQ